MPKKVLTMIFSGYKKIKNTLRLSIESVHSIDAAVKVLGEIAELSALSF